ncbi:ROK family protein [Vallitalea okinawensis]|uniref:ROK family protein n=1 Tax=Vallitalea okinawensis TaxID=2078660 RepID=UPI000CFAFD68|nr:ROK family protein [Vallitalea okinawensis]
MLNTYENKPKTVKLNNRRLILNYMIESGIVTIADIRSDINLSKTTFTKIMNYLLEKNLILEVGKSNSTDEGGRKAVTYHFNSEYAYCIAIHLFPDELYSVITDLNSKVLHSKSEYISADITFEAIISLMADFVRALMELQNVSLHQLAGIAVGSHGLTDYQTGITHYSPHFKNWPKDSSIEGALKKQFPEITEIFVDNQIRFQTLAEKNRGCAINKKNVIVIEAGIGLVAGIIVKEQIKRGTHSFAGEIGHMPLNPESDECCSCGAKGCFEALVSEKRLHRLAQEMRGTYPNSILFQNHDEVTIVSILDAAKLNDLLAVQLIDEVSKWFAIGIINTVLMYDPEIIVIQGAYSHGGKPFLDAIHNKISQYAPILVNINVTLDLSTLGKDRGTLGGSLHVAQRFLEKLSLD